MHEAAWLECSDPVAMLAFLKGKASDRKLRLFGVACCRHIWHLLTNESSRQAVSAAERYADEEIGEKQFQKLGYGAELAYVEANFNVLNPDHSDPHRAGIDEATAIAAFWMSHVLDHSDLAAEAAAEAVRQATGTAEDERQHQAALLREIFGNPFRPILLDSTRKTPTVLQMAQFLYEERRFEDMPVLADALEDAGCTDADILSHCRQPCEHVRGCWVVDLLLGKE